MSAVGLHAFNLLPYRSGARRRARNRALALLAGAGLAGCAAVGAVAVDALLAGGVVAGAVEHAEGGGVGG